MIAAVDVHYSDDATAMAAAVLFSGFADLAALQTQTSVIVKAGRLS
jgi:deoxyinosine 3'endonuclease (endonuclease V)